MIFGMHIYPVKMVCTLLLFGIQDGVSYAKMILSFVFCFELYPMSNFVLVKL